MKRICSFLLCVVAMHSPRAAFGDSPGPTVNPFRAYPPSCLAYPLPTTPSGPGFQGRITLPLYQAAGSEDVTLYIWRTPCSGGTSALLGQLARDNQNVGEGPLPIFPTFEVSQASNGSVFARVSSDPNTVVSALERGTPFDGAITFVFENYASPTTPQYNFSDALMIVANQFTAGYGPVAVNVDAYDVSKYTYGRLPLQISGYMTGNWFDPNHGGEGIQTEIGESGASGTLNNRFITAAWYTFDSTGTPYWLFGQGAFTAGDRSATLSVGYGSNGGFAGNFGSGATFTTWGTMSVQFPDCNTFSFSYQSQAGLPVGVPQGSGSRTWTRLTQASGLACK